MFQGKSTVFFIIFFLFFDYSEYYLNEKQKNLIVLINKNLKELENHPVNPENPVIPDKKNRDLRPV